MITISGSRLLTREAMPAPNQRPVSDRIPRAPASPSAAAALTSAPVIASMSYSRDPSGSVRPDTASRAARPIAVPLA